MNKTTEANKKRHPSKIPPWVKGTKSGKIYVDTNDPEWQEQFWQKVRQASEVMCRIIQNSYKP